MRLLDLVEKDHRVRPAPDRFRQLAAFVVADIPGRRPHQPRRRVPLHELRHVQLDQRVLGVEQVLREGTRQLGLSDSSGAKEDERPDRPARILQPCARPPHRLRDGDDRVVLTDHPLVQLVLHAEEPRGLLFNQAGDGHARPGGHDLSDVLLAHFRHGLAQLVAPRGFFLRQLVLQLLDLVAHRRGRLEILLVDGVILVRALLANFLLQVLQLVGSGRELHADTRRGLVDEVDRLVRQCTVAHVAVAQHHG